MKTGLSLVKILILLVVLSFALASCGGEMETADTVLSDTETAVESAGEEDTDKYGSAASTEDILDENGKVVGKKGFDKTGAILYEEHYDVAGRTVERTDYTSDGKISTVAKYTFLSGETPDNYSIERYEYEGGAMKSRTVAKYHGEGITDSVYEYGADDSLTGAYLYEYDDAGLLIKESRVNSKNVLILVTEYEYEGGRLSKETYRRGSGEIASYTEYEYLERGVISKELNYDAEGTLISYLEYVYGNDGSFVRTDEYVPDENGDFVKF